MQSLAEVERLRRREMFLTRNNRVWLAVVAFTIFYFADVLLRASSKYFWYDELLSLYFARLPDLHSVWGALQTGIDANPPGFDLLNHAVRAVFGEGLIAMRLPEIAGFWVMCLCLFKFVERRAGILAGFIAMTLPMLSGAYYYAYEARPLILVAACAAVALLCWDNAAGFYRRRWLAGFSVALFAALMLHCYAILLVIPFGMAELVRNYRGRRVDWSFWTALTLPVLFCLPLYIALTRIFRAFSKGTDFVFFNRAIWPRVLDFYGFLIVPCSAVILLALACFALGRRSDRNESPIENSSPFTLEDFVLTLGFIALPAFGLLTAQVIHSPYFSRYFLSAILGVCIALAAAGGNRQRWMSQLILGVIVCGLGLNFARIARHRLNGTGESLTEPATQKQLETTPGDPFHEHPLIRSFPNDSAPIAVLNPLEFLYTLQYAPNLASRLYYIHYTDRDSTLRGLRNFRRWSPVTYNAPAAAQKFVEAHPRFYVFSDEKEIGNLNSLGRMASVRSLRTTEDHVLIEMESKPSAETTPK